MSNQPLLRKKKKRGGLIGSDRRDSGTGPLRPKSNSSGEGRRSCASPTLRLPSRGGNWNPGDCWRRNVHATLRPGVPAVYEVPACLSSSSCFIPTIPAFHRSFPRTLVLPSGVGIKRNEKKEKEKHRKQRERRRPAMDESVAVCFHVFGSKLSQVFRPVPAVMQIAFFK